METKKFTVNIHYDYSLNIQIDAENEEDAINKAKNNNSSIYEMEYCGIIGICISNIEDV